MFLVGCSIFENFTGHIQEHVFTNLHLAETGRPVEKGLQFPTYTYDLTQSPPVRISSRFSENLSKALAYMPRSAFISSKLCPTFPKRGSRDILDDLEMKLQTYLLFKKLRNTISHGSFDTSIPTQFEIVQTVVTAAHQGQPTKVTTSKSPSGEYYITHYNVIGFLMLLIDGSGYRFSLSYL
jgi:hypothetical protein